MSIAIDRLMAIASKEDSIVFRVPLVYVKNKKIMTLNTSNQMMYRQRQQIKDVYKAIIYDTISDLNRFGSPHLHMIYQTHYADRRHRDNDNNIYVTKWVQDALVNHGLIDDDKNISFTYLPAIYNPGLDEHFCEITCIDLGHKPIEPNKKELNNETKTT